MQPLNQKKSQKALHSADNHSLVDNPVFYEIFDCMLVLIDSQILNLEAIKSGSVEKSIHSVFEGIF
jgi:hypothetical protein